MSKRDDDADMELGMTTAERRRRRRRGGGLRVPSDNVPRRSPTTPPVVAPVPEDPALAMSIAYSFGSEASEPVPRVTMESEVPSFDPASHEPMQTVIDPPSASVESSDFEMNTREMSAVDLAALGLEDPATRAGNSMPGMESVKSRLATDPSPRRDSDVDIDVDDGDGNGTVQAANDVHQAPTRPLGGARLGSEPGIQPAPQAAAQPARAPRERLRTVALSDEDLEEVREAVRLQTQPAVSPKASKPNINATQPLSALDIEPITSNEKSEPMSVPEIDINELAELADRNDSSGEFEVDVEDVPIKAVPQAAAVAPPPAPPNTDRKSRPPTVPPPVAPSASNTNPGGAAAPISHAAPVTHATPPAPPPQAHAPHGKDAHKDAHGQPPPPPAQAKEHKAPPSPPPKAATKPAVAASPAKVEGKGARGKPWFVDLFDEDYLRTLPFLTPQATQSEAEFVIDAMGLSAGAQVLDIGCGYGRHAMELAARGFHVVGLDISTPLLVRGGEEAMRRGLEINFVRGDMRELDFEAQFDGAYCMFSTFGYFDDETNKKTITNIARALKPGGRVMIEILNRDYVIADLPTRVWWEGEGCVVLEEVELNYFSSRIQVNRSVVFDDGRQLEQEISVRAYSLHEVGKLMHAAGFRVLEVSGGYHTRGRFFGNQSRHIIVLAERKDPAAT